ncbi:MAG: DUF3575 domain-containing protein [Rikenellaceae bacterium]|nr:DUF3575 domain-containing protein [Rikenellaceae bacterium]
MRKILIIFFVMVASQYISLAQKYGIGTDILALTCGTINFDASLMLSKNITLHLPFSWNPVTLRNNYKIKHLATQPGVRWWFWHGYSELFLGANLISSMFNIAVSNDRKQGWAVGASLSLGYAWMMTDRINLEIEAGAGPLYTEYDRFAKEACGDYLGTKKGFIFFPTCFSCSLVYILN